MTNTKERHFNSDWITRHIPLWNEHVFAHMPKGALRILEIGSFEGRSACMIIDNLFPDHPGSVIECVDVWQYKKQHDLFDENIGWHPQVKKHQGRSLSYLVHQFIHNDGQPIYDLIYIDGSHIASDVLTDAVMAWPLLKTGGCMVMDDYPWKHPEGDWIPPKPAIDAFAHCFSDTAQTLKIEWQAYFKKIKPSGLGKDRSAMLATQK
jgi:hypothetical protein